MDERLADSAPPSEACAAHGGRPAVARCAVCQRPTCDLCATQHGSELRCPACAELGLPWEQRAQIGVWRGYLTTFRGALVAPEELFRALPNVRGFGHALRYDLVTQYLGASIPTVVTALGIERSPIAVPAGYGFTLHQLAIACLLLVPLSGPLAVVMDLFLAGVVHGALRFLGIGKGAFDRTYAAIAYGGSADALNATIILPSFFIPQLWNTYSTIIALRHAHRTTSFRAATALLVPYGVLTLIALALLGYFAVGMAHDLAAYQPVPT